ncbi:hypothetical protein Pcinc_025913 [Petrolisthes cinctipes]|uniref:Uncharacterized protein n=1 Tax=Petrolisthes cinctipes TaxID=88211 RepID=A0AAE1KCC9_PETCI|nr:hypothetical protein Pcinc_025913 [Petrolisthes cinctipes]
MDTEKPPSGRGSSKRANRSTLPLLLPSSDASTLSTITQGTSTDTLRSNETNITSLPSTSSSFSYTPTPVDSTSIPLASLISLASSSAPEAPISKPSVVELLPDSEHEAWQKYYDQTATTTTTMKTTATLNPPRVHSVCSLSHSYPASVPDPTSQSYNLIPSAFVISDLFPSSCACPSQGINMFPQAKHTQGYSDACGCSEVNSPNFPAAATTRDTGAIPKNFDAKTRIPGAFILHSGANTRFTDPKTGESGANPPTSGAVSPNSGANIQCSDPNIEESGAKAGNSGANIVNSGAISPNPGAKTRKNSSKHSLCCPRSGFEVVRDSKACTPACKDTFKALNRDLHHSRHQLLSLSLQLANCCLDAGNGKVFKTGFRMGH